MGDKEGDQDDWNPEVPERVCAEDVFVPYDVGNAIGPYLWTVETGSGHDDASENEPLGRAIEVAEIESVGVVCFPG